MEYKEFLKSIQASILDYLPPEYQGASVEVSKFAKVNKQMDGLVIHREGEDASPILYMEQYYEWGGMGVPTVGHPFEEVCKKIAGDYLHASEHVGEVYKGIDKNFIKNNLFLKAVNASLNRTLINSAPHLRIHDLAMLPYSDLGDAGTVLITHAFAEQLKMSGEQVVAEAIRKNPQNMPLMIKSLDAIVREIASGMEDINDRQMEPSPIEVYVLSNEAGSYGASLIANKEVLDYASTIIGGDFYILPSSVHEVLLAKAGFFPEEELKAMVMEVNRSGFISQEEILSDNLYYYDAKKREISIYMGARKETRGEKDKPIR